MERDPREHSENRSVVAYLGFTFFTLGGWVALTTVLGIQMFELTGDELDLGLLGLAEFAPAALLVLVSGTLADRFDRRRIAFLSALVSTSSVVALGVYTSTEPTSTFPIFALVVVFGTARALGQPAARVLPADIVRPARLPWLTIRYSATLQAAAIIFPILGAALYAFEPTLPFIVITVFMVVGSGLMLLVRVGPHALPTTVDRATRDAQQHADAELEAVSVTTARDPGVPEAKTRLHDAMEGLRFIRRQPVLLGAISLDLFAVLFGGAPALIPAIAKERLGADAFGVGVLRSAIGIGAALMVIFLAVRPLRRRVGRTLFVSVAVFGVGTIVLGATTSFVVAFLALAILSAADAVSMFIRATLVPLVTPRSKRGRVSAVEMVFIGASNELGAFESGVAGQLLGPGGAVVLGGVGTLVVTGVWYRLFPSLRRIDTFPDTDPEDTSTDSEREPDPTTSS